jgi:hypothetical protein
MQPRRDRDTLFEARQPGRDLALVVIHRHPAVERPGAGAKEDNVRRDGTLAVDAARAERLERRRDDLDLVAAEQTVLARVWIEGGHAQARPAAEHARQGRVGELDCRGDARGRDHLQGLAQRHVRGDAEGQERGDHVHLAEEALMPRQRGEHPVPVVVAEPAVVRSLLVQREPDPVPWTLG